MTDKKDLIQLWALNICPQCGEQIKPLQRIGTGRRGDGGFCSLACFVEYHGKATAERNELVQRILNNAKPER